MLKKKKIKDLGIVPITNEGFSLPLKANKSGLWSMEIPLISGGSYIEFEVENGNEIFIPTELEDGRTYTFKLYDPDKFLFDDFEYYMTTNKIKEENKPRVGIAVMLFDDENRILLGKRIGSHGDGEYAFPGGHLELYESYSECAKREVLEETGLKIKDIKFLCLDNTINYFPKHYSHIGLTAKAESFKPELLEPDKCSGWDWYNLDDLPKPLFYLTEIMIKGYLSGEIIFFEKGKKLSPYFG